MRPLFEGREGEAERQIAEAEVLLPSMPISPIFPDHRHEPWKELDRVNLAAAAPLMTTPMPSPF
jgi:hypothetical protein